MVSGEEGGNVGAGVGAGEEGGRPRRDRKRRLGSGASEGGERAWEGGAGVRGLWEEVARSHGFYSMGK